MSGCKIFSKNLLTKHILSAILNVSKEREVMIMANTITSEQKAKCIKCYKCAELSDCYKGQHGGKKNCKCFSPKG